MVGCVINLTGRVECSQGEILGIGVGPAVGVEHIGDIPGSRSGSIGVDMHAVNTAEVIVLLNHIRRHLGLLTLAGRRNVQHKLRCNLLGFRIVLRIGLHLLALAPDQRGECSQRKNQYCPFHTYEI